MVTKMNNNNTKREIVNELHRAVRRNFKRRRTLVKGYGDLWQIDLAEMQPYAHINKGYKYILVVIDCYSKFVWTRPLKNKSSIDVANAMKSVFNESKYTPKHIQSDQGTEFYNKTFKKLMDKYTVNHYSTYSTKKAAFAERVIRTLKNWLYKEFSTRGSYKWIDILTDITKYYNNRVHRSIGMKPTSVTLKTKLPLRVKQQSSNYKCKFKVGDFVRISKYKGVFDKGYTPNWSNELFKIIKVQYSKPITYLLEDLQGQTIKGSFYDYELQKSKYPNAYLVEKIIKRKGNSVLVKWLGFPTSHNSWINKNDIL